MKKQKLITSSYDVTSFKSEVNGYLEIGWTVVPNTLSVSVAVSRNDGGHVSSERAFAIVLEKEDGK